MNGGESEYGLLVYALRRALEVRHVLEDNSGCCVEE